MDIEFKDDLDWIDDKLATLVKDTEELRDFSVRVRDGVTGAQKTEMRKVAAALDTGYACMREAKRLLMGAYGTL